MVIPSDGSKGGNHSCGSGTGGGGGGEHVAGRNSALDKDQAVTDKIKNEDHNVQAATSDGHHTGSANDVSETEVQPKEQTGNHPEVPDGGYGWFVVLGSFLAHILIGGIGRSDGLFFLMFQSRFQRSATLTAWPGAMDAMLRLGVGPIASAICQRWSVRACCMIAGIILACGPIITAFTSNFYVLFISHGILQGIGRGLLSSPAIILVNLYFNRRRSLATGLSSSGVGIGMLLLAPLIHFVFDNYGYTGGFLIISAIYLNGLLIAMLFRPLSLHYKFSEHKRSIVKKHSPPETFMLSSTNDTENVTTIRLRPFSANQDVEVEREAVQGVSQHRLTDSPTNENCHESSSSRNEVVAYYSPKKTGFWKSTANILFPVDNTHKKTQDGKRQKTKLFHFELLRDPAFCSFCLSFGIFVATFKSTFTFMPALAKSCGLTSSEAVFILSLSGGADAAGRIVVGYLLDRPALRKRRLVVCNALLFMLAGTCALMPAFGHSFAWLCVTTSAFALMSGVLASQRSVICVDLLGVERMPSAYGILLLFQAFGIGVGPLLLGLCRDAFGGFYEAFLLGAGLMGASACLMVYSTALHIVQRRRQKDPPYTSC